jgi:hypothetical protein
MSRWVCPKCEEMNYTTADPNQIEGYFVTTEMVSNVRKEDRR